jgi:hypothetical protein
LKFVPKTILSRDAAEPNGLKAGTAAAAAAEVEAEAALEVAMVLDEDAALPPGTQGIGLDPFGLTVACILASEEAVGAYSLEEVIVLVAFGRVGTGGITSAGGAGAGLTFFKISAWLCFRILLAAEDEADGLGRPRLPTDE